MDNRTVPKGEVIIGKREGEAGLWGQGEVGVQRREADAEKRKEEGKIEGEGKKGEGRTSGREWEIEEGKE